MAEWRIATGDGTRETVASDQDSTTISITDFSTLRTDAMTTFSDIVDAADNLSTDEQQALLEILSRRVAARNRAELVRDVAEARAEFAAGRARAASVGQIMDEAGSDA